MNLEYFSPLLALITDYLGKPCDYHPTGVFVAMRSAVGKPISSVVMTTATLAMDGTKFERLGWSPRDERGPSKMPNRQEFSPRNISKDSDQECGTQTAIGYEASDRIRRSSRLINY